MTNPHDSLFRRAFGRIANARDLLRSGLPAPIARRIAWRSLRRLPGTFIDRRLRRSHTDLLFSVRIRGRRVLIYVLVEHKSTGDRVTVLQVLGYLHAIWMRHHKNHPRDHRLPPILPFVLHHGATVFAGPTSLRSLLDLDRLPAELIALQPDFSFVLDDLAAQTEDQLQGRVSTVFARLALLFLQFVRANPDQAEALLRNWAALTQRLAGSRDGQDDLLALFSYLVDVAPLPEEHLNTVLNEMAPRGSKTMMTTYQRISRRWTKERGPKLLVKGELRGQVRTLLLQLQKKFGPLPEPLVARIKRARSTTLDRWATQLLAADSLDAVFAE